MEVIANRKTKQLVGQYKVYIDCDKEDYKQLCLSAGDNTTYSFSYNLPLKEWLTVKHFNFNGADRQLHCIVDLDSNRRNHPIKLFKIKYLYDPKIFTPTNKQVFNKVVSELQKLDISIDLETVISLELKL